MGPSFFPELDQHYFADPKDKVPFYYLMWEGGSLVKLVFRLV